MADGSILVPDLTTTAGTIAALVAIVLFFYRKMEQDKQKSEAETRNLLAGETKKCEENYTKLDAKFEEQSKWQRETLHGTLVMNAEALTSLRKAMQERELVPTDSDTAYSLKAPQQQLRLKTK